MEHPFIISTPRSTLAQTDSTYVESRKNKKMKLKD